MWRERGSGLSAVLGRVGGGGGGWGRRWRWEREGVNLNSWLIESRAKLILDHSNKIRQLPRHEFRRTRLSLVKSGLD